MPSRRRRPCRLTRRLRLLTLELFAHFRRPAAGSAAADHHVVVLAGHVLDVCEGASGLPGSSCFASPTIAVGSLAVDEDLDLTHDRGEKAEVIMEGERGGRWLIPLSCATRVLNKSINKLNAEKSLSHILIFLSLSFFRA